MDLIKPFLGILFSLRRRKLKSSKLPLVIGAKNIAWFLGDQLVTFVHDSTAKETVYKGNASIARRLNWVGDMARGFVAFQLTDVQAHDSSDFGIRLRVDGFPPETEESGFTLSTQVKMFYAFKIRDQTSLIT